MPQQQDWFEANAPDKASADWFAQNDMPRIGARVSGAPSSLDGMEMLTAEQEDDLIMNGPKSVPGVLGALAGLMAGPYTAGASIPVGLALEGGATALGAAAGKAMQQRMEGRPLNVREIALEGGIQGGASVLGAGLGLGAVAASKPIANRLMSSSLKIPKSYLDKMAARETAEGGLETAMDKERRLVNAALEAKHNTLTHRGQRWLDDTIDAAEEADSAAIAAAPPNPVAGSGGRLERVADAPLKTWQEGFDTEAEQRAVRGVATRMRRNPRISRAVEVLEPAPDPTPIQAREAMLEARQRVGDAVEQAPAAARPITRGWPGQPEVPPQTFTTASVAGPKPPTPIALRALDTGDAALRGPGASAPRRQMVARTERQLRDLTPQELQGAIRVTNKQLRDLYGNTAAGSTARAGALKDIANEARDLLDLAVPGSRDARRAMAQNIDLRAISQLADLRAARNNAISLTDIISLSAGRPGVFAASMLQKPLIATTVARGAHRLSKDPGLLKTLMAIAHQQGAAASQR